MLQDFVETIVLPNGVEYGVKRSIAVERDGACIAEDVLNKAIELRKAYDPDYDWQEDEFTNLQSDEDLWTIDTADPVMVSFIMLAINEASEANAPDTDETEEGAEE